MSGEVVAFFLLSSMALAGGVLMLGCRQLVHMVLSLLLAFLSIAGIYFLLSAEFVAVVQILVYSGMITLLLIFGLMLAQSRDSEKQKVPLVRKLVLLFSVVVFAVVLFFGINDLQQPMVEVALHESNTEKIGLAIYGDYLIPFEMVSIALLVGLVGAVVLARKEKEDGARD